MIQGVEKKVHFPLSPQTRVQINELRDLHPLLHPKIYYSNKRAQLRIPISNCWGGIKDRYHFISNIMINNSHDIACF